MSNTGTRVYLMDMMGMIEGDMVAPSQCLQQIQANIDLTTVGLRTECLVITQDLLHKDHHLTACPDFHLDMAVPHMAHQVFHRGTEDLLTDGQDFLLDIAINPADRLDNTVAIKPLKVHRQVGHQNIQVTNYSP